MSAATTSLEAVDAALLASGGDGEEATPKPNRGHNDALHDIVAPYVRKLLDVTIGRYQAVQNDPRYFQQFMLVCTDAVEDVLRSMVLRNTEKEKETVKAATGGADEEETIEEVRAQLYRSKASESFLRQTSLELIQELKAARVTSGALEGQIVRRDKLLTDQRQAALREILLLNEAVRQLKQRGTTDIGDVTFHNWNVDQGAENALDEEKGKFESILDAARAKHEHEREQMEARYAKLVEEYRRLQASQQDPGAASIGAMPLGLRAIMVSEEAQCDFSPETDDAEVQTDETGGPTEAPKRYQRPEGAVPGAAASGEDTVEGAASTPPPEDNSSAPVSSRSRKEGGVRVGGLPSIPSGDGLADADQPLDDVIEENPPPPAPPQPKQPTKGLKKKASEKRVHSPPRKMDQSQRSAKATSAAVAKAKPSDPPQPVAATRPATAATRTQKRTQPEPAPDAAKAPVPPVAVPAAVAPDVVVDVTSTKSTPRGGSGTQALMQEALGAVQVQDPLTPMADPLHPATPAAATPAPTAVTVPAVPPVATSTAPAAAPTAAATTSQAKPQRPRTAAAKAVKGADRSKPDSPRSPRQTADSAPTAQRSHHQQHHRGSASHPPGGALRDDDLGDITPFGFDERRMSAGSNARRHMAQYEEDMVQKLEANIAQLTEKLEGLQGQIVEKDKQYAELEAQKSKDEANIRTEDQVLIEQLNDELTVRDQIAKQKTAELSSLQQEMARWFQQYKASQPSDSAPINFGTIRKLNTSVKRAEETEATYRVMSWKLIGLGVQRKIALASMKKDCETYSVHAHTVNEYRQSQHHLDVLDNHTRQRIQKLRHMRRRVRSVANAHWDAVLLYARSVTHAEEPMSNTPRYFSTEEPPVETDGQILSTATSTRDLRSANSFTRPQSAPAPKKLSLQDHGDFPTKLREEVHGSSAADQEPGAPRKQSWEELGAVPTRPAVPGSAPHRLPVPKPRRPMSGNVPSARFSPAALKDMSPEEQRRVLLGMRRQDLDHAAAQRKGAAKELYQMRHSGQDAEMDAGMHKFKLFGRNEKQTPSGSPKK